MKVIIQNDAIQMVCTEKQDLPFVVEAEQERENARYVGRWSREQHESALHDADVLHMVIKNREGRNIGYAIVRGLTNQNNSIELMRIVVTAKGRGYGKAALSLIQAWCFTVKKAHRLWLDVRENNRRAQHVYQSLGFVPEGLLRECIRDGDAYHSLIVMSVLRQDYAAARAGEV